MKVILVAAVSQNGFITNGDEDVVTTWTSVEDKAFFAQIKSQHHMYLMGRKTFETIPNQPSPQKLRVVMTKDPEEFKHLQKPGHVEFTDSTPEEVIEKYQENSSCLLLGGGEIYRQFLTQDLVDEMYITVEPVTFNSGVRFFDSSVDEFISLHPNYTMRFLNDTGTKLYHITR